MTDVNWGRVREIMAKDYRTITIDEWRYLPFDEWKRKSDERRAAVAACSEHEAEDTGGSNLRRGIYNARCKHCHADMSRDSSD